jgi:hypothetical protein
VTSPCLHSRAQLLSLQTDSAPERNLLGKSDFLKTRVPEHLFDLLPGKAFLQSGTKPIIGIGTHDVEISITIRFERN